MGNSNQSTVECVSVRVVAFCVGCAMSSITIELDESSWTDLNEKADLVGVPVERYIGAVLKQHVESGKVRIGVQAPAQLKILREELQSPSIEWQARQPSDLKRSLP